MSDIPEPVLAVMRAWINDEQVKILLEEQALAVGYVTRVRNNGDDMETLYGLHATPAEAFQHAARMQNELNSGLTPEQLAADGFICDVLTVVRADGS